MQNILAITLYFGFEKNSLLRQLDETLIFFKSNRILKLQFSSVDTGNKKERKVPQTHVLFVEKKSSANSSR